MNILGRCIVAFAVWAFLALPAIAQFGPHQTDFRTSVASWTGTLDIHGVGSGTVSGPVAGMNYTTDQHVTGALVLDHFNSLTYAWIGTLTGKITISEKSVLSFGCKVTNTYTADTSAQVDFRGAPLVWNLSLDIGSDTWSLWPSNDSVNGTVTSVQDCAGQQQTSTATNPLRFAPINLKMGFPFPASGHDLNGTQTVTCDGCGNTGGTPVTYTYVYSLKPAGQTQVTVATDPPGLGITVDGANITAPQTFSWDPGSSHSIGAISPQGAATLYTFTGWSDGGARTHTITTPNSNTTYTARFTPQYLLSGTASPPEGGTLTADPGSVNNYYAPQTDVKVTAVPNCGFTFASFSGDLTGATNPQTVTMTKPRAVTANFNAVNGAVCPPNITPNGILNAASNAKGQGVSAGGLVAIYGTNLAAGQSKADHIPLPNILGGVSLTINGTPAPLLFVDKGQINVQVPWNVPNGLVPVVVKNNGVVSSPANVQVVSNSPGIFAVQYGVGQAIAVNPDGTLAAPVGSIPGLITHPAKRGDPIIVYATGLGAVTPAATDGADSSDQLRNTIVTPAVLVGGVSAQVLFSGLAPQFVGVDQLNVVVPPGAPVGDKIPLQLQMGGITTTDQVTIAIQ